MATITGPGPPRNGRVATAGAKVEHLFPDESGRLEKASTREIGLPGAWLDARPVEDTFDIQCAAGVALGRSPREDFCDIFT